MFVDVALPLPLPQTFTYDVPDTFRDIMAVGRRVLVPFQNKRLTGYVVRIKPETELVNVKSIIDVLDDEPILDDHLLRLTEWMSAYYLCAWGEAIRNCLPSGLNPASKRILVYQTRPSLIEAPLKPNHPGSRIIKILREKGTISEAELRQKLSTMPGFQVHLHALIKNGEIAVQDNLRPAQTTIRYQKTVYLAISEENAHDYIEQHAARAPKRTACVEFLLAQNKPVLLSKMNDHGYSNTLVRGLVDKKIAAYGQQEVFRDPLGDEQVEVEIEKSLTAAQQDTFAEIQAAIRQHLFRTFLLHGITGSGKTRVYIEACKEAIRGGQQALVLVPEIALTPQTIFRFQQVFQERVGLWHSSLSAGERYDTWRRTRRGDYDVIVGTRSAVFAPLARLGLIVVDEEHEHTFKQDSVPRYHGRDVAVMRAKMLNAVCLLGSATPSLESYHNARQNRYTLLELPRRIADRPLPMVDIIDMRHEPAANRISRPLAVKIEERLEAGEGIILFLNRRGFSTFVLCRNCGYTYGCDHCHVTLTYHAVNSLLKCHYCDFTRPAPRRCGQCGSANLSYRGTGTQRIEEEIQRRFPKARALRMDVDSTTRKGSHRQILDQFRHGLANILLGTQMVAKGLDFPHVTLVGVISADVTLNFPDFRSAERTFQLLTQVAGRAGRGDRSGEVLIQTYAPKHYAILTARDHAYLPFYEREILERQDLSYPPFSRLIAITISGPKEMDVIQGAEAVFQALRTIQHPSLNDILGPAPAPISKIKDQFRWQLIIKSDNNNDLRRSIYETIYPINVKHSRVVIAINVDPVGI